ncbi:MAG: methyltransferase, partial [Alphaproteobacteria bacterium]
AATASTTASVPKGTAKNIADAITNPARPAADVCQDEFRKPAEMLKFANVTPDTVIAEYIPGAGYFTRIFGKAASGKGHNYVLAQAAPNAAVNALQTDAAYGGKITVMVNANLPSIRPPVPVDLVWTSRNYHDLAGPIREALNKAAFEMLKPGGTYIILDHSAVVGTGDYAMNQIGGAQAALHRIDENLVKLEVLKAGFKLVGEDNSLRNPKDTRTTRVFDGTVRGETDQFILKFEKPKAGAKAAPKAAAKAK